MTSMRYRPVMVETHAAMQQAATIRKATLADVPRVAEVLAAAFYEDPPFTWVLHGDRRHDPPQPGAL
jgi:hypothetical protein